MSAADGPGALRGARGLPGPQRRAGGAGRAGLGRADLSPDAVNVPMIRHWVEAMGDENPVYVSDEAARAAGFEGMIAPPTMLQAWIMRGLRALERDRGGPGRRDGAGRRAQRP